MDGKFPLDTLTNKLKLIEDLWQKLIYVKWSRDGFAGLTQAVRDAVRIARDVEEHDQLAELLTELDQQLNASLATGELPREAEREHLRILLQGLQEATPQADELTVNFKTSRVGKPSMGGELLLLAAAGSRELLPELQGAGFRVHLLTTLTEMRAMLAQATPAAVIVDMDCQEGALLAGINMIAKDSNRINLTVPIFFITERSDLMARLEAVSAGGAAYFTKPVDMPLLLQALYDRLVHAADQGYRVVLVDDTVKEAREMARILEDQGISVRVVNQPMETLQVLSRMPPDLLLLDLDLLEVGGLELVKAIRQHPDFDSLPMLLLSTQADLARRLAALNAGADDLLGKPLAADALGTAVHSRLRRTRVLGHKLARLSHRDAISGLYTRRYFLAQLQRILADARNTGAVAVMLITLDNLRTVAAMDIGASDDVVEQAAQRLLALLALGQQAARFSDAIFAVFFNNTDREALLDSARRVRAALETEPYVVGRESVHLHISIGISLASVEGRNVLSLIQQADLACSSAWVAGGEHIQIYNPQADPKLQTSQQQHLLDDIREAVQQQRMNLMFQPIVSMQGDQGERYEVLLRMHKEGRELLPETVFGVTQRHRLGMVLDRWVIAQSIRLLRKRQASVPATTLFINISPAILKDEEFATWLKGGLEKTGVRPKNLILEMSEGTAQQHLPELRKFLDKVKALGCGFSMDRFNGEEQSLALLKNLPVDYVKLDAKFVYDLADDKEKQQQLKQLVKQLNALHVTTIVINIEKLPTLFALWSCGVNYMQGYFLQRPQEEMSYDFTTSAF